MSAAAVPSAAAVRGSGVGEALSQIGELALRSMKRTLRQPASFVPAVVFPLTLLLVNGAGLDASSTLPGFAAAAGAPERETVPYLDFFIAVTFVQSALFAMMNAGTDVARDVQTGFISRMALTPMRGAFLLIGQLAGGLCLSLASAIIFLTVGFASGMSVEAGVLGVLTIVVMAILVALCFGAAGAMLGLRTGTGEAVQGFFPLFFVLLFLSSMAMPRPLIEQNWFETIATYNPVSYLLEAIRSLIIHGWDGEALALGFGIVGVGTVLTVAGASRALRTRLTRT